MKTTNRRFVLKNIRHGTLQCRALTLIALVLIALGFLLWIVKPTGDVFLTLLAYVAVVGGSTLYGLLHGFWIDLRVTIAAGAAVVAGLYGTLYGLLVGNAGAPSESVFFVAIPIVWYLLAAGITTRAVRMIVNLLPLVGMVVALLGIAFWLHAIGVPGFDWSLAVPLGQTIGDEEDFQFGYALTFAPISSLVFLLPFLLQSLLLPKTYTWLISRIAVGPSSATILFFVFVSGRRVLFVSSAIAIVVGFFIFFLGKEMKRVRIRVYVVGAVTIGVAAIFMVLSRFSPAAFIQSLTDEVFSPDSIRSRSAAALVESWFASPYFGNGLGNVVTGAVRDVSRPWSNELQYLLVLNAVGLPLALMLATAVLALVLTARKLFRADPSDFVYLSPLVVGTLSVLVANATNPYLHTPAHYWMLFLLALAVNGALRAQRGEAVGVSGSFAE